MELQSDFTLRARGFRAAEAPLFTLCNSLQRLAPYPEEGTHAPLAPDCRLNGRPCADWLFLRISVNGQHLMMDDAAADCDLCLDLRTGLFTRSYALTLADGVRVTAQFERILSMERPGIAAQRVTLASDQPALLSLNLGVDANLPDAAACPWTQTACRMAGNTAGLSLRETAGGQEFTHLFTLSAPGPVMGLDIDRRVVFGLNGLLRPDAPCVLARTALNRPGGGADPAELAQAPAFEEVLQQNAGHFARFWQSRGGSLSPAGAAVLFHLHQRGEI